MAAPSVAATATTSISAASASWTVNLPSVVSGDKGKLMFMFIRAGSGATAAPPSGWNQIGAMNNESSQQEYVWWRRVVGNEASTVTLTWSASTKGAVAVALISGNADPNSKSPDNMASTSFTATANTHPDPGLVTMSPTCDALYIAFGSWAANATVTTYPSGYTGAGYVNSGGSSTASDCSVAIPWKQTTASTGDDPGQYTISASERWTCRTLGIFPGNYLAVSANLGPTTTIAMITSKLASIARNFGPTITVNAQKQWFAQITRNLGPTITDSAVVSKLAALTANFGPTIRATLNWGIFPNLGGSFVVGAVTTKFAAVSRNLGITTTLNALGGGFINVVMNLGPAVTVGAGRKVLGVVSSALGWVTDICAWVNPKFLRPFSEDTLTLTQEAEDTMALTSEAEDPFSVVVLAEVTMNLTAESEDTSLTLTTETEESTEC